MSDEIKCNQITRPKWSYGGGGGRYEQVSASGGLVDRSIEELIGRERLWARAERTRLRTPVPRHASAYVAPFNQHISPSL